MKLPHIVDGLALIVAVDFDGTIYAGPFIAADDVSGDPLPGAIEWLKSELARGHTLIIHTCRLTSNHEGCTFPIEAHRDPLRTRDIIRAWLVKHGLTVDETQRIQFWLYPGKPFAHEYLDDKAIRFTGTYPQRETT